MSVYTVISIAFVLIGIISAVVGWSYFAVQGVSKQQINVLHESLYHYRDALHTREEQVADLVKKVEKSTALQTQLSKLEIELSKAKQQNIQIEQYVENISDPKEHKLDNLVHAIHEYVQ